MGHKPRPRYYQPSHHPHSLLALLCSLQTLLAQLSLEQYASQPRWGQASLLLSDNSLIVYGGKVSGTGGYTYTSAPNTDDILHLSLNATFPNSSPPWQYLAGSQLSSPASQMVSFATIGALLEPTATESGMLLAFGGDATSAPNLTSTDSSWVITLPSASSTTSSNPPLKLNQQPATWAQQPMRRVRHTSNTASNSNSLRLWVLGGQKADGSQSVLNELWQYAASKTAPLEGSWSMCAPAPVPLFDHATITVSDASDIVRIYVLGGVGANQKMVDMSNLYRFTPDLNSDSCKGTWDTLQVHSSLVPSPRRGHSAVSLSSTQILLYGGASASGETVYGDLWLLDLAKLSWSQLTSSPTNSPGPRWGQTMVRVGPQVIVAFGFGPLESSQAARSGLGVFDLATFKWSNSYVPSPSTFSDQSSSASGGSLHLPGAGGSSGTSGNNWQVPGFQDPVKSLPLPTSTAGLGTGSSSTPRILGITFGIFGALLVGVGSAFGYRYQKKVKEQRRLAAEAYKRRAYGPDFSGGEMGNDDQVGLVNKDESLHASHNIAHTRDSRAGLVLARPGALKALIGAGVGVRALWAHKRDDRTRERFDMLADEESEVWNMASNSSLRTRDTEGREYNQSQALKKYAAGWTERVRMPPPPPLPMAEISSGAPLVTTRGGLRIWQGLDDPADSQVGFGTSTSFLGASLAPWSDDGRGASSISEHGRYESYEDPFSNAHASPSPSGTSAFGPKQRSWESTSRHDPFADYYDDNVAEEAACRDEPGEYSATELADSQRENSHRPRSDHTSHEIETVRAAANSDQSPSSVRLLSPATSSLISSQPFSYPLERRGTWWERLRYGSDKHGAVDTSPGAFNPIRDPASPPLIPAILEFDDNNIDPDDTILPKNEHTFTIDEYGRCRAGGAGENQTGDQEPAQPSTMARPPGATPSSTHSALTATSSMIEAATAQMIVVQRMRTVDTGQVTDTSSSFQYRPGSQISALSSMEVGPLTSLSSSSEAQVPETPATSEEPAITTPLSPRPKGPRTLSPASERVALPTLSLTIPEPAVARRPTPVRRQTAGALGVRAMVKQFETEENSPNEVRASGGQKKVKLEHGLVKKPVLYVANPDK